ncbi:hypothetical protein Ciccas_013319 [Cichlidogyrus casuarinus]|uniref:PIPK domain-containing protein n=1 Tax=Cichlidogyrus casuarinus TaxID=1844966 RepID=A0ABD2PKW2_9PLAT
MSEENGALSSPEQNQAVGFTNMTPPESPPNDLIMNSMFTGKLDPYTEFYGLTSMAGTTPRCVYFIGLIDILNQYGLRKKTATRYKSVTGHNSDVSNIKPEQYGSRLFEFINTHVE